MRSIRIFMVGVPVAGLLVAALANCVGDDPTTGGSLDSGAPDTSSNEPDGTMSSTDGSSANDGGGAVDSGDAGATCPLPDPKLSGTLDTSFASGTKLAGVHFYARAATVDAAGTTYVVGSAPTCGDAGFGGGSYGYAILHILEDGTLDPAFMPNNNPLCLSISHLDFGFAAAMLPSGAPIFGGSSGNGATSGFGAAFSMEAGALTSFNGNGELLLPAQVGTVVGAGCGNKALVDTGPGFSTINGIAVSKNKIILAGSNTVNVCDANDFIPAGTSGFVLQLNKDGSSDGAFTPVVDATVAGYYGVALDAAGNIIVIGQNLADAGAGYAATVRRFSGASGAAMGTLDVAPAGGMIGRSVAVLPDGHIMIAGPTQIEDPTFIGTLSVMRLTSALAADSTFHGGAPLALPLAVDGYSQYTSLAVLCDGTVLAAGTYNGDAAAPDPQDMALVKVLPTGAIDSKFGASGIAITGFAGAKIPVGAAQDPTTGKVIVVGRDTVPSLVVARFNP